MTTGRCQFVPPAIEFGHKICDVGSGPAAIDAVFGSEMYLKSFNLEPETASTGEGLGFRYFDEPEDTAIESASFVLGI